MMFTFQTNATKSEVTIISTGLDQMNKIKVDFSGQDNGNKVKMFPITQTPEAPF